MHEADNPIAGPIWAMHVPDIEAAALSETGQALREALAVLGCVLADQTVGAGDAEWRSPVSR